jgi:ABC-type maltose transport system permease subunit
MELTKILRILYWILVTIMIMVFYYSLRYAGDQAMEYTFLALAFWAGAFILNRYIKKKKAESED